MFFRGLAKEKIKPTLLNAGPPAAVVQAAFRLSRTLNLSLGRYVFARGGWHRKTAARCSGSA